MKKIKRKKILAILDYLNFNNGTIVYLKQEDLNNINHISSFNFINVENNKAIYEEIQKEENERNDIKVMINCHNLSEKGIKYKNKYKKIIVKFKNIIQTIKNKKITKRSKKIYAINILLKNPHEITIIDDYKWFYYIDLIINENYVIIEKEKTNEWIFNFYDKKKYYQKYNIHGKTYGIKVKNNIKLTNKGEKYLENKSIKFLTFYFPTMMTLISGLAAVISSVISSVISGLISAIK